MKIFNLDNDFNVVCNWQKTRNGFKHTASLHKNGVAVYQTKICYLNRTWEKFEYESILFKVVNDNFEHNQKDNFINVVKQMRG